MKVRPVGGFRNLRVDTFKGVRIEADYRALPRTHEQVLMDRLEAHDYREGSIIAISAKRLRHSRQAAIKHFADLRTPPGQKAAQEAWETPIVEGGDRGAWPSARRQTQHVRNHDPLGHVLIEE